MNRSMLIQVQLPFSVDYGFFEESMLEKAGAYHIQSSIRGVTHNEGRTTVLALLEGEVLAVHQVQLALGVEVEGWGGRIEVRTPLSRPRALSLEGAHLQE